MYPVGNWAWNWKWKEQGSSLRQLRSNHESLIPCRLPVMVSSSPACILPAPGELTRTQLSNKYRR
ncbi:hypothetical protein BDW68DRAFT_166146 [Aspergillus falconensis]